MVESMVKQEDLQSANAAGEARTCEACGARFNCGAARNSCWCFGVQLTEDGRQRLQKSFRSCVCQACLLKYSQNPNSVSQNDIP